MQTDLEPKEKQPFYADRQAWKERMDRKRSAAAFIRDSRVDLDDHRLAEVLGK